MLKLTFAAAAGALALASTPALAEEDLHQVRVLTHRSDAGAVEACELTFAVMTFDGDAVREGYGGSLTVIDATRGGWNVGLNLTVWDGAGLQPPKQAWIMMAADGDQGMPGEELSSRGNTRLFNYAYEAISAPIDAFGRTGELRVSWRNGNMDPREFTLSVAGKPEVHQGWNACIAAMPAA